MRSSLSEDGSGCDGAPAASSGGKGKGPPPPPVGKGGPRPSVTRAPAPAVHCSGMSVGEVRLRPTETRVRKRDGTILTEQRSAGCEGFTAVVVGQELAKPQYVLDQEAGLSRLQPKIFNTEQDRWVARPDSEMAAAPEEPLGTIRVVSYNVWFVEQRQHSRAEALFAILEHENADVICLQEVTPSFLGWLREQEWARERYALSDSVGTTLQGSMLMYGVIMLVRRSLVVRSLLLHVLPTSMNRSVLVASIEFVDANLRIATVHLESLDNIGVRTAQLQQIMSLLTVAGEGGSEGSLAVILAGDMNYDEGSPEELVVQRHGFVDCWLCCDATKAERGITMPEDDALHVSTRIDRVFAWGGLAPLDMRRLGMEEPRPSDHYGLCCDLASSTV